MRPLHIPLTSGLPDAGAPGQWLGRDANGAVYTLRWIPQEKCWGALGWSVSDRRQPWPHLVMLREESAGFIVGHVEGPAIEPAPREGFFAAALQELAGDDANPARRPWSGSVRSPQAPPRLTLAARAVIRPETGPGADASAWSPWLWTAAMLFGLPALALAVVFLAAHTPQAGGKPEAPAQAKERPHG